MTNAERVYIAIDLKSFYASVECVERGLDPLTTHLVVADESRTTKTICLAVTPSLKAYGISGRARLFDVVQQTNRVNYERRRKAPRHKLVGESYDANELAANPSLALSYIVAMPRMALYMEYSTRIYGIYLRHIAPEDIHVYSVDEVFIDVTPYLNTYHSTAHGIALMLIREVLSETGITATVGIGTNLYLAKVAMDIVAKKMTADKDGVRIAELDENSYREKLWTHTPLTDFWRIGNGYARRLASCGIYTMGDIACCSIGRHDSFYSEELLYALFGVNAELLIDHAWGYEPCTIREIKAYKPASNSLSSGQVLKKPYPHDKAKLIVWEMTDLLVLNLVAKKLVTDQIVLHIGYDIVKAQKEGCHDAVYTDHYGRTVPKPAHSSLNLGRYTSSSKQIIEAVLALYERITDANLSVRRVTITANHVIHESSLPKPEDQTEQLSLFTDYEALERERKQAKAEDRREKSLQYAMIDIKQRFGKNAILKGSNLEQDAMTIERNSQIGGHHA